MNFGSRSKSPWIVTCPPFGSWMEVAPREQLGKGVARISFEQGLVTSQSTTAMDSLPAAPPAAAIASGSTARREMDSPPLAGEVSAASAPEVKVTAADTRQVEPKQPPSKKQRVLKMMQSDEQ